MTLHPRPASPVSTHIVETDHPRIHFSMSTTSPRSAPCRRHTRLRPHVLARQQHTASPQGRADDPGGAGPSGTAPVVRSSVDQPLSSPVQCPTVGAMSR